MAVPTTSWSETTPAGSDALAQGDNRLREMKTQIREVIGVDHDFPSSGSASDNGQHLRVTLQEQANLGTGAVGTTILGSQTVTGRGELVYTNEDNVDIQLTSGSNIHAPSLGGTYPAANVGVLASMLNFIYPVGSYYFNDSVSTNPGTLFGIGTWVAVEERVLVGYKSGDADFGTPGGTGGERTHELTIGELAAHTHGVGFLDANNAASGSRELYSRTDYSSPGGAATSGSTGSGTAHNNLQPYRTVYMWRRTA